MVLINTNGILHVYTSPEQILHEFVQQRLVVYTQRKHALIEQYSEQINEVCTRKRFLTKVLENELSIFRQPKDAVCRQMEQHGFPLSLLKVPIDSFTHDNLHALNEKAALLQEQLTRYQSMSPVQFYEHDLTTLQQHAPFRCRKRAR